MATTINLPADSHPRYRRRMRETYRLYRVSGWPVAAARSTIAEALAREAALRPDSDEVPYDGGVETD